MVVLLSIKLIFNKVSLYFYLESCWQYGIPAWCKLQTTWLVVWTFSQVVSTFALRSPGWGGRASISPFHFVSTLIIAYSMIGSGVLLSDIIRHI